MRLKWAQKEEKGDLDPKLKFLSKDRKQRMIIFIDDFNMPNKEKYMA